ncbi:MFS transporter [Lentzea sp. BCCO 10_0061]|uniref:MFS transporter n=1 Tax=Lentzea sokolovensis TaxID=3095429 RepID=A0ABU4V7R1_9PSEU|nr:MFS transporter [Lentzea sp. BCCO 10_0061]MDX8147836.1 MFS transporter [Lentzea sp. BCCO 10_0061]
MSLVLDSPVAERTATNVRHGRGFWAVAGTFLIAMAYSTVPAPLFPLYVAREGFSTFAITVVFAAFAVGVVISLVLAGHVSDWAGRKAILIPALGLEIVSALLFLTSTSLPVLIVARVVNGLGVGMIAATATAYLHDLHSRHRPGASPRRFEIVSTAANIGGLGVGALVAGALAQYAPSPLSTPYVVLAVLLVASIAAVALTPETVVRKRVSYRPQRISADHGDRTGYVAAAAGAFSAFAVFGVFTSVSPGFVAGQLHHPSRLLAGLVVFLVFGGAALAQTVTGGLSLSVRRALGLGGQAIGVLLVVAGMHATSFPLFLVGGAVAGIGAGVQFKASIGAVSAMAAPEKRGEALATLFFIAYLGLSVPSLSIGLATRYLAPTTVMAWFAGVLLVLLAGVAALSRRASGTGAGRPSRT